MNPFDRTCRSRETVVKLRSGGAGCNPFVELRVSIARNCSKIDILVVLVMMVLVLVVLVLARVLVLALMLVLCCAGVAGAGAGTAAAGAGAGGTGAGAGVELDWYLEEPVLTKGLTYLQDL